MIQHSMWAKRHNLVTEITSIVISLYAFTNSQYESKSEHSQKSWTTKLGFGWTLDSPPPYQCVSLVNLERLSSSLINVSQWKTIQKTKLKSARIGQMFWLPGICVLKVKSKVIWGQHSTNFTIQTNKMLLM